MIEFRTLGSLDLRGSEGEELLSVLSQPKRLALLAYLAVANPRGFHRRDKLLGLFWPEKDQASARHALNQALYSLRRSLGDEVLVSRGADEVGLSWEQFWCDAKAFSDAVEAGDPEAAVELYRGDLLQGLFIADAPEFEKWLDGARERLRAAAAEAAWKAAHRQLAAGRIIHGERLAQRALSLVPTGEVEVQRFIEALAAAGDRAAAVQFYEQFADALRQELDVRPHAETRKLVEDIRMSRELRASSAAPHEALGTRTRDRGSVLDRLRTTLSDRYQVEREIGRGGMATVYLAEDLRHQRKVAMKVLDPDVSEALGTERFLREIETAANLTHPHILPLHDSGEAGGLLYYVMPYVGGGSLRGRLDREEQLPVDEALRVTREVADALQYAHERGIVHRDIKPANILLEADHAVLADFGVAKAVADADETGLPPAGASFGTPAYMSPEQASGRGELDWRSDLYSLGCVLYEMLAGEPPVTDSSVQKMLSRKLLGQISSVRNACPEVPPNVDRALTKALATEPGERFTTVGEFVEALEGLGPPRRTVWMGRWPRWAATASVAIAMALAWYVGSSRSGGPGVDSGEGLSVNQVAVLPFTVRGSEELAYLEAGMAQLLAIALDGAGELSSVDPRTVLGFMQRQPPPDPLDPEIGREIAARFGAGSFILGDLVAAGGEIRAIASLYGVGSEPQTSADAMVTEETQILSDLVDEVARQLVGGRADIAGDQLTRLGAVTTHSLTALKAYLRGEALFRSGIMNPAGARSAVAEYRQAVAADTAFALAYFRMALLQDLVPVSLDVGDAAELARRFSDRLPPQEGRLLECYSAIHRADGGEAERWCREAVGRDRSNADAWFLLGEALHHYGLRRGRTINEVRDVYDRAMDLEPSYLYGSLLGHRAWIAEVEEDFAGWAEYRESWAQMNSQHPLSRPFQLAVDVFRGDERALAQMITAGVNAQGAILWAIETWPLENRSATVQVLRAMTAPDQSRARRAWGHVLIAQEELAAGRLSAARVELAEALSLEPDRSMISRAYLLLSPYLPLSEGDFRALRDEVAGWSPAEPDNRVWRIYLLGLLDERLDDATGAERFASELDTHATTESAEDGTNAGTLAEDVALYLRARLAARAGQNDEAWALLQETKPERWWPVMAHRTYLKQLYERWLTAEVLVALDRREEALHWLAGIGMDGERSYMGIRHFRMAEIYEDLGNREKAAYHYGRFVTYWKDADQELQLRVEEAWQKIEALSAER